MNKLRVLHLEDNYADAYFVRQMLESAGYQPEITVAATQQEFTEAMQPTAPDLILADNGLPNFSSMKALEIVRENHPDLPFIFVSGAGDSSLVKKRLEAGATDYVLKGQLWQLPQAVRRATSESSREKERVQLIAHDRAMLRLVSVVQELSMARTLEAVMTVVRRAARELTGADGATFVLRDEDKCFYAEEDAIAPLWKGQRFPMSACISGWAMLNRQTAVIPDIYADPRIPADAYRPTFVKSLVMVPIRTAAPIGAIGTYWATPRRATDDEVELLQALANTTSVALESVQLFAELEQRVLDRTLQYTAANKELEAFSYSVSHDLQAPLRAIGGFSQLLAARAQSQLDAKSQQYLQNILDETQRMTELIADLLRLANFAKVEVRHTKVDLSDIAEQVIARLRASEPGRPVEVRLTPDLEAQGDIGLLRVVMENLLSNAWKYSSKRDGAVIEFGSVPQSDGTLAFFVRDNGAGFDMQYAKKLFGPFQRMHRQEEFPGTGVGLATVQRVIQRHGGHIWCEAEVDKGATFFFTLPPPRVLPNR